MRDAFKRAAEDIAEARQKGMSLHDAAKLLLGTLRSEEGRETTPVSFEQECALFEAECADKLAHASKLAIFHAAEQILRAEAPGFSTTYMPDADAFSALVLKIDTAVIAGDAGLARILGDRS